MNKRLNSKSANPMSLRFGLSTIGKRNGAIYTPAEFANYIASKVADLFFDKITHESKDGSGGCQFKRNPQDWRILDPACGDGILLDVIWSNLNRRINQLHPLGEYKYKMKPLDVLCGVDFDRNAIKRTKKRLSNLSPDINKKGVSPKVINTNSLTPFNYSNVKSGWKRIMCSFDAMEGFDIIFANPPWGADYTKYRKNLSNKYFSLLEGQFDTSDLFLELSFSLLRENGILAFIIPDSIFMSERKRLRELIVKNSKICFLGRFGEKIFDNINRSCAVIICMKTSSESVGEINCLRLTPGVKKRILKGQMSFEDADKLLGHKVFQDRFIRNRHFLFDIDVKNQDIRTLHKFRNLSTTLGEFMTSNRGVELSKSGKIYQCDNCRNWFPLPLSSEKECPKCGEVVRINFDRARCIVTSNRSRGFRPLIIGENVMRYSAHNGFWIDTKYSGIKYKDSNIYIPPKILIRKTGVGISASIDYTNSMVNQVVYILRVAETFSKLLPIEFFLGLINSRAIYFYLAKCYGETEWRSHPYLTQQQILDFPIPSLDILLNGKRKHIESIASIIRSTLRNNAEITPIYDAEIERRVADIYLLTKNDYRVIYQTLNSVEELLPIRTLKSIKISDIFS